VFRTTIVKTFHVALDVMFATARYRIDVNVLSRAARTILTNSTFMFGSETFIGGHLYRRKNAFSDSGLQASAKNSSSQIGLPASREMEDHCGSGVGAVMFWCDLGSGILQTLCRGLRDFATTPGVPSTSPANRNHNSYSFIHLPLPEAYYAAGRAAVIFELWRGSSTARV